MELLPFVQDPDPVPFGPSMLATRTGPMRILQPHIRHGFLTQEDGARSLRGQDAYVPVSWDKALSLVADNMTRTRRDHGNQAIYAGSYGWGSAGRFHHPQSQLKRFMNLFGGATYSSGTYSYAAAETILPHVVAPMSTLLRDHTSWAAIARARSLVVAFGGMAPRNAAVNAGGVGRHMQNHDMLSAHAKGARFVNVSPDRSDVAPALHADWVPVRPGSDLAMMLAIAHVLLTENLCDEAFLKSHCSGWPEFKAYLRSADHSPAWAASICDVPAETITALARRMASGPCVINCSWSMSRQHNGEAIFWMSVALAAMLGTIGLPGQGFAVGLAVTEAIGKHRQTVPWAAVPTGTSPTKSIVPVARIADALLGPGTPFRFDGHTGTYPELRMIYWAGGNPFHHHQDLNRLRRAWQRPECIVAHEQFWTPNARHADIVLPATLGLERNDIACSPRDDYVVASSQLFSPAGQSKNDHQIFAALAERLTASDRGATFRDQFTDGLSEDEWLTRLYAESKVRAASKGVALPPEETFWHDGYFCVPEPAEPATLLEPFRSEPDTHPLGTPSGRIELFSPTIAANGDPGHPVWSPPTEWLGSDQDGLHLITHQPAHRLHSQLDHGPASLAGKSNGREILRIAPADARPRGIADGMAVRLFNDRGACLATAQLDEGMRQGVISMPTGAWMDLDWSGDPRCCKHGNPNMLTADRGTSDMSQGPSALTCMVEVEPITDPPEVSAHQPPRFVAL